MHGHHGAARGRRGHRREQGRGRDAETQLLALHVAQGRVHAQSRQQGVARTFGPGHGHHGGHKDQHHGRQDGPSLPEVSNHPPERETQGRGNQEDRQHLHQVGEGRGVFIRVCRVGIEEAAAIGSQQLDGLLRRHGPHGQCLRSRAGLLHLYVARRIQQRHAIGASHRRLVDRCLQGRHLPVAVKVLDDALRHEENGDHQGNRHQHPQRDAREIGPDIADGAKARAGHAPVSAALCRKATNQRKGHGDAGRRREEILHRQPKHLRQVAHGAFAAVSLPVGVGHKTDGCIEGCVRRHRRHPLGVERQPVLQALQRINGQGAQRVERQQGHRISAPPHRCVRTHTGQAIQRRLHPQHPARHAAGDQCGEQSAQWPGQQAQQRQE